MFNLVSNFLKIFESLLQEKAHEKRFKSAPVYCYEKPSETWRGAIEVQLFLSLDLPFNLLFFSLCLSLYYCVKIFLYSNLHLHRNQPQLYQETENVDKTSLFSWFEIETSGD